MTPQQRSTKPSIGGSEELLSGLPEGHVIHTLASEHVQIIGILRKLDELRNILIQKPSLEESTEILEEISHSAGLLLDAEKHHLREEQVVCLEMERRGISGPPEIMRQEHNLLRPIKKRLLDLATTEAEKREFETLQREINETTDRIISNLLLHINKEDKVLYPTALEIIDDPDTWSNMRLQCDEIGYCSFTPGVDTSMKEVG
ncbi:MAG: hemerythrin domain-containing protein [Fidelibacterota bacterium]|nr:MAG: hemerythrin domain-containing protein [Candidatus Neomarinimicrobiota bacterium]